MPASPLKDEVRRAALACRDGLTDSARAIAAAALAARALPVPSGSGVVVAGYAPFRTELDPRPLMRALAAKGTHLALPRMEGRAAPLVFHAWTLDAPLITGPYGIAEPSPASPVCDPDIVLVPLAGFDRAGHRLGYGAGFYDRTLAALRARKRVVAIGLAFAVQEVDAVPHDPHDERLDFVATERETMAVG
jgi:5-formyltetrahydrofolate cyclo-ligase